MTNNKPSEDFFYIFVAIAFIVFAFGSCVYNIGYPWNCEQAKDAVRKAESEQNKAFSEAEKKVNGGIVDKSSQDIELDIRVATNNKIYAEQDQDKKCSK